MNTLDLKLILGESTLDYPKLLNEYLKNLHNGLSLQEYIHGRYKVILNNEKIGILELDEFEPEFIKPHFRITQHQGEGVTTSLLRALTKLAKFYKKKIKLVVANQAVDAFNKILSRGFKTIDLASNVYIVESTETQYLKAICEKKNTKKVITSRYSKIEKGNSRWKIGKKN